MASQRQTIGDPLGVAFKAIKARVVADFMSQRPPSRAGKPLTSAEFDVLMTVIWKAFGAMAAPVSPDGTLIVGTQNDANGDPQLTLQVSGGVGIATVPFTIYQFWRGLDKGLIDATGSGRDLFVEPNLGSPTLTDDLPSGGRGITFDGTTMLTCADVSGIIQRTGDISVVIGFMLHALPAAGTWRMLFQINKNSIDEEANAILAIGVYDDGSLGVHHEYGPEDPESYDPIHDLVGDDSNHETHMFALGLQPEKLYWLAVVRAGREYRVHLNAEDVRVSSIVNLPTGGSESLLSIGGTPWASVGVNATIVSVALYAGALSEQDSIDVHRTDMHVWGAASLQRYTTAYAVDFRELASQNLLTGGSGGKTIAGKVWTLANADKLQSAYLNDGTHAGLYLLCTSDNSSNSQAALSAGALYVPFETLSSELSRTGFASLLDVWLWFLVETPHVPDYADENPEVGVLWRMSSYSAGSLVRYGIGHLYASGALSAGNSHFNYNSISTRGGGQATPVPDVLALRLTGGSVYTYYGTSVNGAFPSRSSLTASSAGARTLPLSVVAGIAPYGDPLHAWISVASGNTRGNADILLKKLLVEYR